MDPDSMTSTLDHNNGSTPKARVVSAERGWGWWADSWALFTKSPLLWVALGLILFVGMGVVSMVPVLGAVAVALLWPVLLAGCLIAAKKVHEGGNLEVADLFSGFQGERLTPLLVLGAVLLAGVVLVGIVGGLMGMGAVFGVMMGGARQSSTAVMAAMGAGFGVLLICLVFFAVTSAALWFAPALVVFQGVPAVEALKLSFFAVMRNWVAFLVFGVVYFVAAIVASLLFGLGWLVLLPVSMLAVFVSWGEVFGGS